jgi:hypothetical protein
MIVKRVQTAAQRKKTIQKPLDRSHYAKLHGSLLLVRGYYALSASISLLVNKTGLIDKSPD